MLINLLLTAILLLSLAGSLWFLQCIVLTAPFICSPKEVVTTMIEMATVQKGDIVIDLGAGDGRLLLAAKRAAPDSTVRGYEIHIFAWIIGWFRCLGSGVSLRLSNLFYAPIGEADVLFLYLWPSVLEKLMPKLEREGKDGLRIISHSFSFPHLVPVLEKVLFIKGKRHTVRLYVLRKKISYPSLPLI